jgi:hypothetical protein
VAEKLVVANFVQNIGEDWIFLSIKDAIDAWLFTLQESKNKIEEV